MNDHAMKQAEHTADNIRSELWRTLEELDRRRLEAMDWKSQLRAHWGILAAMGGVVAAMVAAKLLLNRRARTHVPKHVVKERARAAKRAWKHPDRLAPARDNAAVDFGTKLFTIFGGAVANQLAKKLATSVVK